ncbi:MAG TPA: hypothetical protein VJN96_04260 [Vicinamibacterales bacterium]|nr:hypothetical protein [Vicinamibacterales bacterium]
MNQLYWRRRAIVNKLIDAANARRSAHAKLLKGKGGDVSPAEQSHATALRAAVAEVRAILAGADHDPSPATMNAVTDTLQALPTSAPLGRLTEPLQLVGFEALAGLVPTSALRALVPPPPPAPPRDAADKKKQGSTRRRDLADTIRALRAAKQDGRRAEAAAAQAQRTLARVRQERDRLQDQLQFAVKQIEDAANEVREREQERARAEQEASRLDAKLKALRAEA